MKKILSILLAALLCVSLFAACGESKPACVCAEGSLVQKGRSYRPVLEALIQKEIVEKLGIRTEYRIGNETTLPGSAAAALLN